MARALGLTFTPWGMLEGGALTGKYLDESDEPRRYDGVGHEANALAREVSPSRRRSARRRRRSRSRGCARSRGTRFRSSAPAPSAQLRENLGALDVELAQRAARPPLPRRASSAPGSRETSSSRTTCAGSSSATRSSSSTTRARLATRERWSGRLETLERPSEHRVESGEVLRRRQVDAHVGLDREPAIARALLALVVPRGDVDGPADGRERHGERVAVRLDPSAGRLADDDGARGAIDLGGEVRGGGERRARRRGGTACRACSPASSARRSISEPYVVLSPPPFSRTSTMTRRTFGPRTSRSSVAQERRASARARSCSST